MFEVEEMEGCHSCKYGEKFDTDKEPCKYCYGLSLYTKGGKSMTVDETIMQATLLKDGVGKDTYKYEILTSLIDIAKKYQSIEEMADRPTGNNAEEKAYNYMMIVKDIKEVLEDG